MILQGVVLMKDLIRNYWGFKIKRICEFIRTRNRKFICGRRSRTTECYSVESSFTYNGMLFR